MIVPVPVFSVIDIPVPATSVTPVEPDVFELITEVVEVPAPTESTPSFVKDPSTSVPVIVILPEVADRVFMPPAVMVTSVPVVELS